MCPIVVPHKPSASTTSHPPLKKINSRKPDTLSLSSFGSGMEKILNLVFLMNVIVILFGLFI